VGAARRHGDGRADAPVGGRGDSPRGGRADAPGGAGGTLYVVATPIGNLGDVTHRAIEVLRAVPLIAAEDTRITRRLLDRYQVPTPTTSYHAQSAPEREQELLTHLAGGADLALVTDAGTPLVSDPGDGLVSRWAAAGGRVVAVPGASSVLAAVAATGIAGPRWSFEGFLPRTGRDRRERLAAIAGDARGWVLFEGPNRVADTLADLATACGGDRAAAVCRELTKLHEQILRGSLDALARAAREGAIPARGEVVIVVGWGRGRERLEADADAREEALAAARERVDALVREGVARGEAARRVAHETGFPRRSLYGADTTPRPPGP
jgi:16S rRNA (cytidine1402-2'-O)-methyltransferase